MSTDLTQVPSEESEIPDSSQMSLVALPDDAPNLGRNKGKKPDYKECSNTDSETQDATDEASAESEDAAEDIPAHIMIPRVTTRSQAKKEAGIGENATPYHTLRSNAVKRSRDGQQGKTTRPAKRGRPSAADTLIKKFEKDALGLAERFASKVRELEKSRYDNQVSNYEVKCLESELEKQQKDRMEAESALNQEISGLINKHSRMKTELLSALDEAKKDHGKYAKVSDSEIRGNWMMLSYNIRDLVSQHLTENPADQGAILKSLVTSNQLLSERDISTLRACILRRAIWIIAILPVFSGRQPVWQGDIGATLTELLSSRNFQHMDNPKYLQIIGQIKWRAVAELSDEGNLNIEAMQVLVDKTTERLYRFIPDSNMECFKMEMKKLITKAADLHSTMMKSKAIFLTKWIGDNAGKQLVPYDQTKMTSNQCGKDFDTSNSLVKFVEAPALMKIGNADGEKFDTSMVLCESYVRLKDDDDDMNEIGEDVEEVKEIKNESPELDLFHEKISPKVGYFKSADSP